MEVLKESLEPTITEAMIRWNLPHGYSLTDTAPRMFHSMYVGNSYTAFAFLQREHCDDNVYEKSGTGSATISGKIGKDDIQITVKPSTPLCVTPEQEKKAAALLIQNAVWSKLVDLEQQAVATSRMNTCAVQEEPESKRPCWDGSGSHGCGVTDKAPSAIHDQLLNISLQSHIPSPLTYLQSKSLSGKIVQMLPYYKHTNKGGNNGIAMPARHKARHHGRKLHRHHRSTTGSQASFSFASIARNTLSSVSGRLKSMVGLFVSHPTLDSANDVQMLEDEVEYQEKKGSQLQLDSSYNLIYPPFYYSSEVECKASLSSAKSAFTNQVYPNEEKPVPEVVISDTDSNSSMDPDWDNHKQPNDLLPLIHMQLFSGAWPLVRPFSDAVGIPLDKIRNLPLADKPGLSSCVTNSTDNMEDEDKANFWCTAMAVVCLEEYFAHLHTEWELLAYKGKMWLEQNQYQCNLTLDETYDIARCLILKRTLPE